MQKKTIIIQKRMMLPLLLKLSKSDKQILKGLESFANDIITNNIFTSYGAEKFIANYDRKLRSILLYLIKKYPLLYILKNINMLFDNIHLVSSIRVVTANILSESEKEEVSSQLNLLHDNIVGLKKSVDKSSIAFYINKDIIDGIIIYIGDTKFDYSIDYKIRSAL